MSTPEPSHDPVLVEEPIIVPHDETGPDFRIYLSDQPVDVIKTWSSDTPGDAPVIGGYGSSTMKDSDGHIFEISALESYRESCPENMTTWRDHEYRVIVDELGELIERPIVEVPANYGRRGVTLGQGEGPISALRVKSMIHVEDPPTDPGLYAINRAVYGRVQRGKEYGWSVGVNYVDVAKIYDRSRGIPTGLRVKEVKAAELSVVGLQANPFAWTELVRKSLVRKGVLPPNATDKELGERIRYFDGFDDVTQVMLMRLNQYNYDTFGYFLSEAPVKRHSF